MTELQRRLQELSGTRKDAVGAANAWAGTTGLGLEGALNVKAGTRGLGLNGVIRYLTGSSSEPNLALAAGEPFNLARGKPVTFSQGASTNGSRVTDEDTASLNFAGGVAGLGSATVDLGRIYTVDTVKVWHSHGDGRTYHDAKTEVSADGTTWFTTYEAPWGANLLANPDYEAALVNTAPFGAVSVTTTTSDKHGGTRAVSVTTTATGNQGLIHYAPVGTSVVAGTKVRCGAWVKGAPGQTLALGGRAVSPDQATLYLTAMGQATATATGAWQFLQTAEWTYTGGPFCPGLSATSSGASGVVLLVDDSTVTARTEYGETASGRTDSFPAREVRYVRDWINGSTTNTQNQWVEIQVFA